ncbi:hypothetical protein Tco_0130099, partial [Tanacetum coccineum]
MCVDLASYHSLNKTKQVWKATGKLFANVGYQWRSTGKKVALGKLNCGYQWRPTGKKFALGELYPLTKLFVQCLVQIILWYLDSGCSKLDLEESMAPVRISVDIFVRAFTTSANVPSIYIQLFWNTLTHDANIRVYSSQVDEHWLTLSADLLRKALDITPAYSTHPFESPPAGKT